MKTIIFVFACLFLTPAAQAGECHFSWSTSLYELKHATDPEIRSLHGVCLVRHGLEASEVSQLLLRVIRDPKEDVFLREDLIAALAETPLRRKVRVQGKITPELNKQDTDAVSRTVASAQNILAVTQAVKSMEEIVPVTRQEKDFLQALSDIALDDSNHVILRSVAVDALEKIASQVAGSGLYEERSLRLVQETLQVVAARADNSSYYSGASLAYDRLAAAGLPYFTSSPGAGGRRLSSEKAPVPLKR